ncbi:MAG: metal ABC transporter ATP-binding protein [Chloroflexi bacterium]|nr:metal ABC transporter ATP-binding protein [Chloroflexota bacterium]
MTVHVLEKPASSKEHIVETLPPVLAVDKLTVKYQQQIGCENVNFATYPGERIAVIGPNGAGKSSLFKAIVGLHPVFTGQIRIAGNTVRQASKLISYVPQHESIDWNFPVSIWDTVMMVRTRLIGPFLLPRQRDRQAVQSALEQVDLWDLRHRQIGELSGGQRRRIFIARALAQEAKLVLMDEPFVGVDVKVETEIFDVLDILRREDITVLIATHNLAQAANHFDKVLMLNRHQIVFGKPVEVFTRDNLARTFGGTLRMWEEDGGLIMITDDPCHEDHHH